MGLFEQELLLKISPRAKTTIVYDLAQFSTELFQNNINTFLRLAHFLGQAAHETDGFRTLEEYASGAAYEGRRDLGNTQPGDGVKYKGRGIFQLTGRANYKTYGNMIQYDLENNPLKAADGLMSMKVACAYWNNKNLSALADKDDIMGITRKINGGTNGLDSRTTYTANAKVAIATLYPDLSLLVAQKGDRSPFITWIQGKLNAKGFSVGSPDGIYGAKTAAAVEGFQLSQQINTTGIVNLETLKRLRE